MPVLSVSITNKVATFHKRGGGVVCGNKDYVIEFSFDSEWEGYEDKTARFIWGGKFYDVPFTGTTCAMPMVRRTETVSVGVYAGDLCTTTPAVIPCQRSVLCGADTPHDENEAHYASEAQEAAREAKQSAETATASAETATASAAEATLAATTAQAAAQEAKGAADSVLQASEQIDDRFNEVNGYIGDVDQYVQGVSADAGAALEQSTKNKNSIAEIQTAMESANRQYELIEEITLEEAVSSFYRNIDTNGEAYNLRAIRVMVKATVAEGASSTTTLAFNVRGERGALLLHQTVNSALSSSSEMVTKFVARNEQGLIDYYAVVSAVSDNGNRIMRDGYFNDHWTNVTAFTVTPHPTTVLIPAGTKITIYGIKEATNAT